ncbi:MAG TPA: acyl-CoA dehydratase activase [Thermodesulfobacteriota bacterium]|nr:acyl-CoA dehydratase activase [Thermodesulfobacteriota bacterium]
MSSGIDLGSRFVKVVQTADFKSFTKIHIDTVQFLTTHLKLDAAVITPAEVLKSLNLNPENRLVVTGYGKHLLGKGIKAITEIRAHFRGACYQTGLKDFILVELGGQDSKVLWIENQRVLDFQTNDKCAAGTGRYLENMARLLNLSVKQLAKETEDPISINNTCAIFGETEIIGYLMDRVPVPKICAGINDSVARQIIRMIRRYPTLPLVLCGGVALNHGVKTLVSRRYGAPIIIPKEPQFNGAIGCCLEGMILNKIYRLPRP